MYIYNNVGGSGHRSPLHYILKIFSYYFANDGSFSISHSAI